MEGPRRGPSSRSAPRRRPTVVVAGQNLVAGGPLSVFQDCLAALGPRRDRYRIVAIVHGKGLFDVAGVKLLECPRSRRSWFHRVWYEWVVFRRISRRLKPRLWLAIHDMTPNVSAEVQAVYCHSPAPFYRLRPRDFWLDPYFALFALLYWYAYRINIQRNVWVIVQQVWLRDAFVTLVPRARLLVARPSVRDFDPQQGREGREAFLFFYPARSRVFKNFEAVCEAAALLEREAACSFELVLTIDGSEGRYARSVVRRYRGLRCVRFVGQISRDQVFELYARTDCLVFPSRLETWGLPLTEFAHFDRPILAADFPYARETLAGYPRAKFFDPRDARELAECMRLAMAGRLVFDPTPVAPVEPPFAQGWDETLDILLDEARGDRTSAVPSS